MGVGVINFTYDKATKQLIIFIKFNSLEWKLINYLGMIMNHKKAPNKPNIKLPETKNGNPCNGDKECQKRLIEALSDCV